MLDRVDEQCLLTAMLDGFELGNQTRGVVAGAFGRAGALGSRSDVVFGEPDRYGVQPTLEAAVDRGCDQDVTDHLRRPHPKERLTSEHEGAEVQGSFTFRRYPIRVHLDQHVDRAHESRDWKLRECESLSGALKSRRICFWPKHRDRP